MSEFGRLNEHLIASIYEVDRAGNAKDGESVRAPITEASLEVSLGWQSPFEAMGPEATSPTLLAMVQSGSASDLISAFGGGRLGSILTGGLNAIVEGLTDKSLDFEKLVASGVGRTGLTKMNSTQVFTGMPPVKINATVLFRAWKNPKTEVEEPFDRLMGWALPQCLQKDSWLTAMLSEEPVSCPNESGGSAGGLDALLPSLTPKMVGLTYKGRTYKPLVIESIGFPMDSPITADGRYTELLVPVTFATWQTYDAKDWDNIRTIPL